jgi:hypothetical protein
MSNGDSNMPLQQVLGHAYIIINIILTFHMLLAVKQKPHRPNVHTGIDLTLFDMVAVPVSFAYPYSTT